MPWILKSKGIGRAVLVLGCLWVLASTGCGVISHFDEEWAIGAMIQIKEAEKSFKSANGRYGTLDELVASHLAVPSRVQYGYQFTVRATPESYVAVAVPTASQEIGPFRLYLDQSGTIRATYENREANVKDPPLKGYGVNP